MTAPTTAVSRHGNRLLAIAAALALLGGAIVAQPVQPASAAVTVPTADVLDVTFSTTGPVENSHNAAATIVGTPTYAADATLKRPVATFAGGSGVRYPMTDAWSTTNPDNILNSATVECAFRYDGVLPAPATNAMCAGRQGGGYSLDVNGSEVRFVVGTTIARATLQIGQWYYAVGTFDGTAVKLYLNGALAAQATKTSANAAPSELYWFIGGDTKAAGAIETTATGAVGISRIWSDTFSADQVSALYAQDTTVASVPKPDVLDVDFASGTAVDNAQDLPASVIGAPAYNTDPALDRSVVSFNGASGIRYPFTDPWDPASAHNITNAVTIECTFRFDGVLPTAANNSACSGRQTGGYTIDVSGSDLRFIIGGSPVVIAKVPATAGRWYHAAATYDGATATLYVNGVDVAHVARTGAVPAPTTKFWVIGADTGTNTNIEFYGSVTVASARIWSTALSASQVAELSLAALGDQDSGVALTSTAPAAGSNLTTPAKFQIEIENQGAASGWTYVLDGAAITPGQTIGAGMRSGSHLIVITATDLFGTPIRWEVPFTSANIPVSGGTETGQGKGSVTLSAAATDPDGGRVTTTFEESTASAANGGFQGIVPIVPTTLDFTYTDGEQVGGEQSQDDTTAKSAASHDQIPFQRFDVSVPATGDDRRVQWSGVVDPERTVTISAWNAAKSAWVELATSRGSSDGDTVLVGEATESLVDASSGSPVVHVLVTAEDPFADDLAARDASAGTAASKDHFEDPDDYDFSIVHWSDPQYLTEGATGGSGQWPASVDYPTSSGTQTPEEQAVWAATVNDSMKWIVDNAATRKIAFVANSGDLVNNDYYNPDLTDAAGNLLYPGLDAQVQRENTFISHAYGVVASSGIPNQVLAGNHDNQVGVETGTQSRYSQTFTASSWYDQAGDWPAGAEYHAWDESLNADGSVASAGSDNQDSYVLFSAGGLDFVSVALSYGVTSAEVDWANSIFERYKDRNGILTTHGYMGYSLNKDGRDGPLADDGNLLYDQVVSANSNIVLVLAGHRHGSGINLKSLSGTDSTHKVVELLSDYQAYLVPASTVFSNDNCPTCVFGSNGSIDVDGNGTVDHAGADKLIVGSSFLRLLQFNTKKSTVSVDSYSPFLDEFGPTKYDPLSRYNGAEENFTVPIDLVSRTTSFQTDALTVVTPNGTVIGTASAASGWPATVNWTGLTEGKTYAWAATSRNAAGDDLGTVEQYGGVFVASAAGTDATPPVIDLPDTGSVPQNEAFDPLDGVTATDNADGDVTDRLQVVGAVDVTTPGSYTLLYSVTDGNGNVTQAARTIRVIATPAPVLTATTMSAKDVSVTFGEGATLVASVSPAGAGGTVQFSNGEDVLCQAVVDAGTATCSVDILPPPGTYAIETAYSGDSSHAPSERSFVLTVKDGSLTGGTGTGSGTGTGTGTGPSTSTPSGAASKATTSVTATATVASYGTASKVAVAVATPAGTTGLTGTVTISGAGKTQTKSVGTGSLTYALSKTLKPGSYSVKVAYSGDDRVAATTSTLVVKVAKRTASAPKTSITKRPTTKAAGRATVTVSRPSGLTAVTGKVTVTLSSGKHTKRVTVTLKSGKASVKLPKLSSGTWKVSTKYAGNSYYAAKTRTGTTFTVR